MPVNSSLSQLTNHRVPPVLEDKPVDDAAVELAALRQAAFMHEFHPAAVQANLLQFLSVCIQEITLK